MSRTSQDPAARGVRVVRESDGLKVKVPPPDGGRVRADAIAAEHFKTAKKRR